MKGTRAASSIEKAISIIKQHPGENTIVFMLTDGKLQD